MGVKTKLMIITEKFAVDSVIQFLIQNQSFGLGFTQRPPGSGGVKITVLNNIQFDLRINLRMRRWEPTTFNQKVP